MQVEVFAQGVIQKLHAALGVGSVDPVAAMPGYGDIEVPQEGGHGHITGFSVIGA